MRPARFHPVLASDIAGVLATTLELFGPRQYDRYERIIQDVLEHILEYPERGRPVKGAPE